MRIGDRVYVVTDEKHVGTVEAIRDEQTKVRWHKGYATWEASHNLRSKTS